MKKFFFAALCLLGMAAIPAQAQKLHENASLETSHLWRGLEVGNGLILANNVRLGATYKLKVGKFTIPVGGQMMWNPEASKAYFRATVTLLDI